MSVCANVIGYSLGESGGAKTKTPQISRWLGDVHSNVESEVKACRGGLEKTFLGIRR